MNRRMVSTAMLCTMLLIPASASAELRKVDLKTLGMD